ncbi:BTB/POZ and MATH domain-containing protein 4-like [Hibiscus syriacus]|uniref:BTB/POZ and MATH domain-containing protein 4-like n=1 Tax=Hibiscus syriacus TaxID=106335 RepID=UPI00192226C6|nr:BTB/POZ and MATH domain-containing protein 4-like [Hibiscus syriacus]
MPSPLGSPTSSRSVTQTVNGSHRFTIKGYSLAKGMGVGIHIASETFTVGSYQWAIYFYPDGKNSEDHSTYVSVFVALASEGTDVRALFELTLLYQSGKGKHKVHSHFDRALESGPYTLKYRRSMCLLALLHFIYRDSLIDDEEFAGTSSSCMPSIPDALTEKLFAAAEKYDLPRLRLMCESVLCKDVSVNSVANILALSDHHHAMDLKAVCLKFAAENLVAVMRSDGFEYHKENCPSLQSEILKTVAGCEEEFSGEGKSRSVWAQFSDGGDTINRSVRQQTWENGGEQNEGVWVQLEEGGGEGSPRQEE